MRIEVECENCGSRFRVASQHTGRTGKCPKCQQSIKVPDLSAVDASVPDAAVGSSPRRASGKVLRPCPECGERIPTGRSRCPSCGILYSSARARKRGEAEGDFFEPEKKALNMGVLGGALLILIAVVWFVVGYAAGYIFYYPPILAAIGVFGVIRGLSTGNLVGKKPPARRTSRRAKP